MRWRHALEQQLDCACRTGPHRCDERRDAFVICQSTEPRRLVRVRVCLQQAREHLQRLMVGAVGGAASIQFASVQSPSQGSIRPKPHCRGVNSRPLPRSRTNFSMTYIRVAALWRRHSGRHRAGVTARLLADCQSLQLSSGWSGRLRRDSQPDAAQPARHATRPLRQNRRHIRPACRQRRQAPRASARRTQGRASASTFRRVRPRTTVGLGMRVCPIEPAPSRWGHTGRNHFLSTREIALRHAVQKLGGRLGAGNLRARPASRHMGVLFSLPSARRRESPCTFG